MFGSKSIAALGFAALSAAIAGIAGLLSPAYLHELTGSSCVLVGLFASVATTLVSLGWRPSRRSHWAVALQDGRPRVVAGPDAPPRELPGAAQQALFALGFACIGLSAFTNRASAQLLAVPDAMGSMSASEYCPELEEPADDEPAEAPEPEPVDIQGCALIKRAYELGYAKSLGSCAPKARPAITVPPPERTLCTLRQRDEPVLHYNWRMLSERGGELGDVSPGGAIGDTVDEFQIRLGYLDTLMESQLHAITASPHASHHLFTNLPAPDDRGALSELLSPDNCSTHYAGLPLAVLTPADGVTPSQLVDRAFGHLLFDGRFGATPGNCREYVVHWGASEDVCDRLRKDVAGTLEDYDALEPVRDVLSRLRSHRKLRQMAGDLDVRPLIEDPPLAREVVSVQCLIVGAEAEASGTDLNLGRDRFSLREVHVAEVATSGALQLDIYTQLASLLAGGSYAGPALEDPLQRLAAHTPTASDLAGDGYALTRLDHLRDTDPFLAVRWPLEVPELAEVFPLRHHMQAFIDAFRFRYWAQRGRL